MYSKNIFCPLFLAFSTPTSQTCFENFSPSENLEWKLFYTLAQKATRGEHLKSFQ